MVGGEGGHAEVEAAGRRGEELAVGHVVGRRRVLGLELVLVAAGRGRRPVRGRGPRVRAVLVVVVLVVAAVQAPVPAPGPVAPGQLERLALDAVLHGPVLLVGVQQPVAELELRRQVVDGALDHREVRRRGVVVVERRREDPGPLGRVVVRVGRVPLVAPDLGAAQQLLDRRRGRGGGGGRRAAPGEAALVRQLVVGPEVVVVTAASATAACAADAPADAADDATGAPARGQGAHVRQLRQGSGTR